MSGTSMLEETSEIIIVIIIETVRKLEKLAARISEPGVAEKFQAIFTRMEARVTKLLDQYRQTRKSVADKESASVSIQPEPEPEYDPEFREAWMVAA